MGLRSFSHLQCKIVQIQFDCSRFSLVPVIMRLDDKSESGSNENRVCLCFGTVVFMTLPVMSEKCLQQGVQFSDSTTSVDILFLYSQKL